MAGFGDEFGPFASYSLSELDFPHMQIRIDDDGTIFFLGLIWDEFILPMWTFANVIANTTEEVLIC